MAFLSATVLSSADIFEAPRYAVEDVLNYLVSEHLQADVADERTRNKLHRLFLDYVGLIGSDDGHTRSVSQWSITLLLRHSDHLRALTLFHALIKTESKVHAQSLLQFMNKFTQQGRPDLAMEALRRHVASGAGVSSGAVQSSCMALLRMPFDHNERYRIQSHLLTEMLELGIRPGMPMLNTMILNAVEACDYQTAQAMFETARTHGIRRDTITYSILLKIARDRLDASFVETIMQSAEEDGALPRDNKLVFRLLVTILEIAQAHNPGTVDGASWYRTMLQVYTRYCDTRPLVDLGIYLNVDGQVGASSLISQPSPQLLAIMILGYIRFSGQHFGVRNLYHRYQTLVAGNHDLIAPTTKTQHVANAFLQCLGQDKRTLAMCPLILKDMLNPPASVIVQIARPNVQSWSIVLKSYFFHGQIAAGKKILKMMRERGVEPNEVTMNTIIAGYARMQDAFAAVNALQQMEVLGFAADSYTFKGLTRVIDRDQLLDALRTVAGKTNTTVDE
ncbi:MAG: hypothetical protein Q9219_001990 [cf. Caloplaca sp. 3 TL-2023]